MSLSLQTCQGLLVWFLAKPGLLSSMDMNLFPSDQEPDSQAPLSDLVSLENPSWQCRNDKTAHLDCLVTVSLGWGFHIPPSAFTTIPNRAGALYTPDTRSTTPRTRPFL